MALRDDDAAARERLEVLGEMTAEVAHELHNVLQIISSSAYVARQSVDRGDAAAARPHVARIEQKARVAHAIVDDLMALARGETLRTEPAPVAELVAAARADFAPGAAAWVDDIEPGLKVRVHAGLVTRLLHALYDNAIHASAPRAPSIATRARAVRSPGGPGVALEIADDGPGVPAELAPRVFEPLVTARPGGTGLGLALARRIAAAHGGTIALVDSGDPRHPGAAFRIELPT